MAAAALGPSAVLRPCPAALGSLTASRFGCGLRASSRPCAARGRPGLRLKSFSFNAVNGAFACLDRVDACAACRGAPICSADDALRQQRWARAGWASGPGERHSTRGHSLCTLSILRQAFLPRPLLDAANAARLLAAGSDRRRRQYGATRVGLRRYACRGSNHFGPLTDATEPDAAHMLALAGSIGAGITRAGGSA